MMKKHLSCTIFFLMSICALQFLVMAETMNVHYEEKWESLSKHPIPVWFKDAKFGIYAHLGVYCVPAYSDEWYPREMYQQSDDADSVYQYHKRTYGDQSQFGYKDFIPMFTLEKFDPAEWADLYARAGAKFAGPVAEHHDGFAMWASSVNRWNAVDMGPKRDVVGELVREIRKRNMKVVTSFHHAFNFEGYYTKGEGWDTADPKYADLYGQQDINISLKTWLEKLKEVIDAYQPDQIWFDFGLGKIPDSYKKKFAAYYYNKEAEWGKSVIITRKGDQLPEGVGVLDIERGRMSGMGKQLWQTDDSTGAKRPWCWVKGIRFKPASEILDTLIDIVSKNGVLLLNVCPKADGTICEEQKEALLEVGKWLKVNGDAIYATRPWELYGEGPTRMKRGGGFVGTIHYTSQDVRFTRSKDGKTLYAITLGWPEGPFTLRSMHVKQTQPHASVQLLGTEESVSYSVNNDGSLTITPPSLSASQRPCKYAFSFKLTGFELVANPLYLPDAIILPAKNAILDGEQIRQEENSGRINIGYWDNPSDTVHWLVRIPRAGEYQVVCEAAAMQSSRLKIVCEGDDTVFNVPPTKNWQDARLISAGTLRFEKPGVYHLRLIATDPSSWKAVNIWQLKLAPAGKKQD